jgi:hypothetical protein
MSIFHRHKWKTISAQQGTFEWGGGDGTAILYRCKCGRTKQETINGHWTLEQLTGKTKFEDDMRKEQGY